MAKPSFPFTPNEDANKLLAENGTALLIGLCLEQQVRSYKAMAGPYVLRERLGYLDARKIAATPDKKLDEVFRATPAIHRFPGMMAKRVKSLCARIAEEYAGDGARVWARVTSAAELHRRLCGLPGFGDAKAASGVRMLATFGRRALRGWQRYSSDEDMPWLFKNGERVDKI
jgi:uncharacterized HhH-GPD family protein